MKNVTPATFAVTAVGLISSIAVVSHYSTDCLQFIWIAHAILFAVAYLIELKNASTRSKVAVLTTTCIISILSVFAYGGVSFRTSHTSTEALVFAILPVFSIGLMPVIYLVSKYLFRFVMLIKQMKK